MSQSPQLCRLCLRSCSGNDYRGLYDENEVYSITFKYFDAMVLTMKYDITAICLQCWNHITEFNDFQKSVYLAQKHFFEDDEKPKGFIVKSEDDFYEETFSQAKNNHLTESETLKAKIAIKAEQDYIALPEIEVIDIHDDDREFISTELADFVVAEFSDENDTTDQQLLLDSPNLFTEHEEQTLNCKFCGESHRNIRDLKHHIRYWHPQSNKVAQTEATFTCDECGKVAKSRVALYKHKWYHSKMKRKFTCEICNKMFLTASNLRDHHSTIHARKEVKRSYTCTKCGRICIGGTDFREHIATHIGVDIYTCSHCPKTFKCRTNLHAHRKKDHPIEFEMKRQNMIVIE